jgi:hypothetical protein
MMAAPYFKHLRILACTNIGSLFQMPKSQAGGFLRSLHWASLIAGM